MVLGGHYSGTNQVIGLKNSTTLLHSVHSQLQLLADRQSSQLLEELAVI